MVLRKMFGVFLILVCVNNYIQAQDKMILLSKNKIDSLAEENNLTAAIDEYRQLQEIDTLKANQYLEIASFHSQTKQNDSAFFYLDKVLISDSSFSDLSAIYKSTFYFTVDDSRWNDWILKVMDNYSENINPIIHFD